MNQMNLYCPTRIEFGKGALQSLAPEEKRVLVLHGSSVPTPVLTSLVRQLNQSGHEVMTVEKGGGEPGSADVDAYVRGNGMKWDAVVAIGGGSVLDFAKAVALLKISGGGIADYEFGAREITGALPLYAVPTTCGSGSEVTQYAVINNSDTARKFTIADDCLRPKKAFVDPGFLTSLPRQVLMASALDAFIHSFEAHLSESRNDLISPLAIRSMELVHQFLPVALGRGTQRDWMTPLGIASVYGGICISANRTGLIHTLSVAFSEFVKRPHGLLNACLLPYVIEFNVEHSHGRLVRAVNAFSGKSFGSDRSAAEFLIDWIGEIYPVEKNPLRGVEIGDLPHITARVLQDRGLPSVNSREVDERSIRNLVAGIINDQKRR